MEEFGPREAARLIPLPQPQSNKYKRGCLSIVAGSGRFPGAACLAASAAPRCGAGYTTLITPEPAVAAARAHLVSVPVVSAAADEAGCFSADAVEFVVAAMAKSHAFVVGPGLGRSASCDDFVLGLLGHEDLGSKTAVIDADALNAIAEHPEAFHGARPEGCQQILTPHEGEATRLLGHPVTDRLEAARELADAWHSTVILKGPETLIAAADGAVRICRNAGPELAKAGSGDVLSGMVGAFAAQGLNPVDAAALAVYLHGKVGAMAAAEMTTVSVIPEDLLGFIAPAIRLMENWDVRLAKARTQAASRAQS